MERQKISWTLSPAQRKAQRAQRRADNFQRAQARGNTVLLPTYRDVYKGSEIASRVYLGHRAKFAIRMQSPLMDNVSRLKLGPAVSEDAVRCFVEAASRRTPQASA